MQGEGTKVRPITRSTRQVGPVITASKRIQMLPSLRLSVYMSLKHRLDRKEVILAARRYEQGEGTKVRPITRSTRQVGPVIAVSK